MRFVYITLIILSVLGCETHTTASSKEKLARLFNAQPISDAKADYSNGNRRFIAVHNHDLIPPKNIPTCLVEKMGHRLISNQDFEYGSYDYQRFGALAELYANWYNYALWEMLETEGLSDC